MLLLRGMAWPTAKASRMAAPSTGEPMAATTPSTAISAGVHTGQIATENGTGQRKCAPHAGHPLVHFDVGDPAPGPVELAITRPGEAAPRVFRWER